MKCNKCGFISFDYLSECRGCGADISAVRDELGFLPVKPDLPFSSSTPRSRLRR